MKAAVLATILASLVVLAPKGFAEDASSGGSRARPLDSGSASVRFAVIGDYGIAGQPGADPEGDVANLVKSWSPDFIVTVGDNNYPLGNQSTIDANVGQYYHDFIYPYAGTYEPGADVNRFFPTLGNHDWYTTDVPLPPSPYLDYFTLPELSGNERYYKFEWGPAHFFMLDSDSHEPDGITDASTQAMWFHDRLAESTSPWNLVLMHHAPYSSGSGHGSIVTMQWPFQAWGADAVLAGHDHTYERIIKAGLPYFVNGLGGASRYGFVTPVQGSMVRYSSDWGAMLVQANSLQMTFQFITRTGVLVDTYVLKKYPNLHSDNDGDRASDPSYFHAATGLWGMLKSSAGFAYSSAQFRTWGQTGDTATPGDYDGDGLMDPTVRRPPVGAQSAAYLMLLSSTGNDYGLVRTVPAGWPALGDVPVVGDYNGDGISDPAIWRGNTGVWIIPLSPAFSTYRFKSWGQVGDQPIEADVDGDGQSDIGYFRPSTGVWGFLLSSQAYSYGSPQFFSWGSPADTPVMADYDGDGKADPAVVIPPAGAQSQAYRILLSSKGYDTAQAMTVPAGWPGLGDTPVPGDYDGDGKVDAAIWRGNTGVWIIPLSSNGSYLFKAWGASGDQPLK